MPTTAPTVDPDSPEGAAQVLRGYYAAIDARDFPRAYEAWENGGRASGQTFAEFRQGFAETAHVVARVGPPGPIGAAAGSRYVEVPVDVTATTSDGRTQRFQGTVTLRRAVVDGATPEQRRWRINRADVRELPSGAIPPAIPATTRSSASAAAPPGSGVPATQAPTPKPADHRPPPTAGVCPDADGPIAVVRINPDVPAPRCRRVTPERRLELVKNTGRPARVRLAQVDVTLGTHQEQTAERRFRAYLAPGIHHPAASAYPGSDVELWLQR